MIIGESSAPLEYDRRVFSTSEQPVCFLHVESSPPLVLSGISINLHITFTFSKGIFVLLGAKADVNLKPKSEPIKRSRSCCHYDISLDAAEFYNDWAGIEKKFPSKCREPSSVHDS